MFKQKNEEKNWRKSRKPTPVFLNCQLSIVNCQYASLSPLISSAVISFLSSARQA